MSASYVPVAADAGNYLRVTASYTDANGADKTRAGCHRLPRCCGCRAANPRADPHSRAHAGAHGHAHTGSHGYTNARAATATLEPTATSSAYDLDHAGA